MVTIDDRKSIASPISPAQEWSSAIENSGTEGSRMPSLSTINRFWLVAAMLFLAAGRSRAQTTITQPGYTVGLNALGALASLKVGGVELLSQPLELCPDVKWTVNRMEALPGHGTTVFLKSDRGTGQIDYRFDAKRVTVTLTHRLGGFQSWQATFDTGVLGVENLQNTAVEGAEAIQYTDRGDIRPTPCTGQSRMQRMRLHLRDGATVLFWHDGWGAPFNIDEIGSFTDYRYRRNLLDNNKPMQVIFELEKPAGGALQPAPAYIPIGASFANLFYYGEPVGFTLRFQDTALERLKAAKTWRAGWTITDFFGTPVTRGSIIVESATAVSSKFAAVSFPCNQHGWFSVLFTLTPVGGVTPPVLPAEYRTRFAVVDKRADFPELPAPGASISDYGYVALLGLKCVRESHALRDYFPEKGKTDWKRLDEVIDHADLEAKKWNVHWFFQANEVPNWCTPADYEQLVYTMVDHCKDRCKTWEVENEPNFRFSPEDYVRKAFVPFVTGAKRADPTCQVIGPACVSVPNTLRFMAALIAAGADKRMDGVSTHTYMGPGEPWELFGNPEYLAQLRAISGGKPLWQTEQGYTWSHTGRQEQARYVTRQYLNAEAVGIANERQYYFYPVHNGFEPWYLIEKNNTDSASGTLEPAAVALRVLNEQTAGLTVGAREEPRTGIYLLRYAGADHDTVAVWTLDFPITLTLRGKIEGATDIMGNPKVLVRQGMDTRVPADGYALYLRIPHGATLSVVAPAPFGTNYASAMQGATATASSEARDHPAAHAIDGRWAMRDEVPGLATRTYWEAGLMGATQDAPTWLQVDFPQERTLDRALLLTPLPAVDGGVPRDFTLQTSDDGQHWKIVATVDHWVGWADMVTFKPVQTRHARLSITRLNDGWHLDGRWMFMVGPDFKRYTSMQARVLDWMLFGPDTPKGLSQ
jgi:hypothetical protein